MKLSIECPGPQALAASAPSNEPLWVLKFGSSLLRTIEDVPAVAGEIYRQQRTGKRIVAVVSALGGETDRLLAEAQSIAGGTDCRGTAALVSLGEDRAVALLAIACDRIGIRVATCRAEDLGLHAEGDEREAVFERLDPAPLRAKLASHQVVIVPGFVGLADDGRRRLLGRGGSDLTATFLASELSAAGVRLYKDVDGVYDADPAEARGARKFDQISYHDVLKVARQLVHDKAVELSYRRSLPIEVEGLGSNAPTRIGGSSQIRANDHEQRPIRVALAGFGVVGQAVAARLTGNPHFEVRSVLVRDVAKAREVKPPVPPTNSSEAFLAVESDVLVDLLSCEDSAARLCRDTLPKGIHLVTASKRLVSDSWSDLHWQAARGGATLRYSASVGGSAGILEAVRRQRGAGPIHQVTGILNGTVNFILQRLHDGDDFEAALAEARRRGFAEECCEADLSGADAAAKLRLIAATAFGIVPTTLDVTTDRLDAALAQRIAASGERWVQRSRVTAHEDALVAEVRLCPACEGGIQVSPDEWNVASIEGVDGVVKTVTGRGAGGPATAEAVIADLYDLLHVRRPASRAAIPA